MKKKDKKTNSLRKDAINVIVIGTVVFVIIITLIIFLIVIWNDGKITGGTSKNAKNAKNDESTYLKISASNIAKYTNASTENIDSRITNIYVSDIKSLLSSVNYIDIYNKLNNKFVEENNLSEKNIEGYLKENGFVGEMVGVEDVTFYEEDNTYIYRLMCVIDYEVKYVNIIETSPYNYTLDFKQDTVPIIGRSSYNIKVDDIRFEIKIKTKKPDAIVYEVKFINEGEKKVKFDFTSVNNVCLRMSDNGIIKEPSSILENDTDYTISKDSYFIKTFYFPANMQYHKDIMGMNFYNVMVGNINKNIYLTF